MDAGAPDGDEERDPDEHDRTGSGVPIDALGESADGQGTAYDTLPPVGDGDDAGVAVPASVWQAGRSEAEAVIDAAYPVESVRPADEFPLSGLAVPPRQAVQPDGIEPDVVDRPGRPARAPRTARARQPEEAGESTAVRAETPTDPLPHPLAADHREPGYAAPPHGPAPTADPDLPARVAHQPIQSVRRTPVADAVRAFKAEAMAAAYDDTAYDDMAYDDTADAAAEDATQDVDAANPDGPAGGGTAVPHGPETGTDRLPGGRMGDLMADLLGNPARPEPRSAHPELTARPLPGLNGDPLADALAAKLFTQVEGLWTTAFDEAERDWLDRPSRPPRLEHTRPYGRPGGLAQPDPETRQSLVQAVSGRFPDPRGTWIRLINAEGPSEDPFRSNNAVDCALSVMSTWHGEPVVAARRQPEFDPNGRPLLTGETGGVTRAEEWLGQRFEYVGHGRRAYVAIAQRLIFGGHGAAAVLITRWPGGGSHAWNAVNCRGEVLWIDAQRGHMALEPPYEDVTGVFAVVIDRQGQRL
ncbi:toxin glutamine deamidase domain-containing protein [Microbispora sp. ATCC PTA-5024]|uniref:toxin glutamine deamidase domain-containing protein n=1 Tax=Microbispora sp. ATCC PTA-5024 TaxID=316330 RepID=UPI001E2CA386|nr:toxin glutamine deamidase domain-containing protein [Microbispora sp. ATCC PTA-5024]